MIKFKLFINKLFDGSKQQVAKRLIIIGVAIVVSICFILNLNITPGNDKDGLVSVKEAQSKTDLEIIDDNKVAEDTIKPTISAQSHNDKHTVYKSEDENKSDLENDVKSTDDNNSKDYTDNDNNKINTSNNKDNIENGNTENSSEYKENSNSISNKNNISNTVSPTENTNKTQNSSSNSSILNSELNYKEDEEQIVPTNKPNKITCTIEIRCDRVVENIDLIDNPEIKGYIPEDGVILKKTSISVNEESSVYEVLVAMTAKKNIHLDATYSKMYKSAYINGINHLYEKKVKSTSGWVYLVNEKKPSMGCGSYIVKDGDEIVWAYSVEGYGEDI